MSIKFEVPKIEKLSYTLPDNKIAKFPLEQRDESKLLIFKSNSISHTSFCKIKNELKTSDLLVFNNTKVIQARLYFKKETGALIEIFCLEPYSPKEYNLAFQAQHSCKWQCMIGNNKKWKNGKLKLNTNIQTENIQIEAERIQELENGESIIEFSWNSNHYFSEILNAIGQTPIPPYLNRKAEEKDKKTYQTVYSKFEGSVAAPTSGLHFTNNTLSALKKKGIIIEELTLHVGAGTFKPIKEKNAADHQMHAETFNAKISLIKKLAKHDGRIVAVGTTTLRTLESLYYLGVMAFSKKLNQSNHFSILQWDIYTMQKNISRKEAFNALYQKMKNENTEILYAQTQIMISPNYSVKSIDGIITNFHQPESTLLLLVAALVGENWKKIYKYALENNFRFLSYGDSSILWKLNYKL
ncbi:MAG: S-adenosylmethionine:tRNA ribosyltransferase-isomerase [Bacteroidales bacterium]|nr:S-adenosylmethionine:tRNA ribosyltransferase-isomerase [Bacteroidales bacterium]